MPAVAIVVEAYIAPMIASLVPETILGSTILADAVTGIAIGAVGGAAQAAATGQDIGKGALRGAEAGGAGGLVSGAFDVGMEAKGWMTKAPDASRAVSSGLGQAAGAAATGANLGEALRSGVASGLGQYAAGKIVSGEGTIPALERATIRQEATSGIRQLLGGQQQQQPAYTPPQATISGQGQQASPGTAALAQALRVGDAGGPIFGAGGEDKGKKKSGWNIESLRYMGSEA